MNMTVGVAVRMGTWAGVGVELQPVGASGPGRSST